MERGRRALSPISADLFSVPAHGSWHRSSATLTPEAHTLLGSLAACARPWFRFSPADFAIPRHDRSSCRSRATAAIHEADRAGTQPYDVLPSREWQQAAGRVWPAKCNYAKARTRRPRRPPSRCPVTSSSFRPINDNGMTMLP